MSLSFLRHLAFEGPLRNFFLEDYAQLSERSTGMMLRFRRDVRTTKFFDRYGYFDYLPRDLRLAYQFILENKIEESDWMNRYNRAEKDWIIHYYVDGWDQNWSGPFEGEPPVEIVVDLRKRFSPKEEFPSNYNGYPISYRTRGAMNAQYASGLSVDCAGKKGTICGTIEDSHATYALTCGHVGQSNGDFVYGVGRSPNKIGEVIETVIPTSTGNCNRVAAPAQNGVDACLIELDASQPAINNYLTGVAPIADISDGDYLHIHAQGSRRAKKVRVAGASIWKKIDLLNNGIEVCCGDVFEFTEANFSYLNSPVTKAGDSGAPLLFNNTSSNWAGMLIGGVSGSSYATYAEHVFDWACQTVPQASFS